MHFIKHSDRKSSMILVLSHIAHHCKRSLVTGR